MAQILMGISTRVKVGRRFTHRGVKCAENTDLGRLPISSLFQSLSAESGWGQSRDPAQHSVLPDLAAEPIGDVAAGQACCSARMKDDRPRTRAAQSKLLKENKGGALSPPK